MLQRSWIDWFWWYPGGRGIPGGSKDPGPTPWGVAGCPTPPVWWGGTHRGKPHVSKSFFNNNGKKLARVPKRAENNNKMIPTLPTVGAATQPQGLLYPGGGVQRSPRCQTWCG